MRFYLSSFKIGYPTSVERLKELLPANKKVAYISNALDFAAGESQDKHREWDTRELTEVGLEVEPLDLRDYFGRAEELATKLKDYGVIYVSGGNVYDLRIAMRLSGFDDALKTMLDDDVLYAGYSAAVCVLSPTLRGYHIVDDPNNGTYGNHETIWDGLNLIGWQFAPHFDSDHGESEDINKEISYCKEHGLPFKPLRDGDVIILEEPERRG